MFLLWYIEVITIFDYSLPVHNTPDGVPPWSFLASASAWSYKAWLFLQQSLWRTRLCRQTPAWTRLLLGWVWGVIYSNNHNIRLFPCRSQYSRRGTAMILSGFCLRLVLQSGTVLATKPAKGSAYADRLPPETAFSRSELGVCRRGDIFRPKTAWDGVFKETIGPVLKIFYVETKREIN